MSARRSRMPAEWEPHRATWVAFPSHRDLWEDNLAQARSEFVGLCRGIASASRPVRACAARNQSAPETLEVLVLDHAGELAAEAALDGLRVRFHRVPFGDIWLRDTAPSFLRAHDGALVAACFKFNGWGEKYLLGGDDRVGTRIAEIAGARIREIGFVLEGGAIEVDGEGTCLTTRQCMLNENRNLGIDEARATSLLSGSLGVDHVVWIDRGLLNDHTDGHIDTLARFVAPGVVACMEPQDDDDPNREVLLEIIDTLGRSRDAAGRKLELVTVPSPGAIMDRDGRVMPASYLNFYISNTAVAVPVYGSEFDDEAVARLVSCFPGRTVFGSSARAILTGGGAFHCITQQEPLLSAGDGG